MLSFKFRNMKIPSRSHFKKYALNNNIKNTNVMEDPKYVKSDGSGLCRLVAIKNRYSCDIYKAFRNLAEDPPLDKPGTTTITPQRAAGLIELESLRILNLIEALNYDLDDHTVVLNYLYPETTTQTANRSAAVNYIIERASDYLDFDLKKGNLVESLNQYCQSSKFRNPLKGYRKGYSIDINGKYVKCDVKLQEVYKDPHSQHFDKSVCYDKRIRSIQNKGGVINASYNNTYNQYIKKKTGEIEDCKLVKHKNPKFYQRNSVSSSSRLARLKYDTLSRTSKTCCGDYKAVPQKDLLGIVKSNIEPCKIPTTATPGQCYIIINGRKRKKR